MDRLVIITKKTMAGVTIRHGWGRKEFESDFPPFPQMTNITAMMIPNKLWLIGM